MTGRLKLKRRKELQEQYRHRRPQAGVLGVLSPDGMRYLVRASADVQALVRRERFQLDLGSHPCKPLQQAWNAVEGQGFRIEVLRELERKEDDDGQDVQEELDILKMLVEQDLLAQGKQPY